MGDGVCVVVMNMVHVKCGKCVYVWLGPVYEVNG